MVRNPQQVEHYRWARCLQPLPLSKVMQLGVPLPAEYLQILAPCLSWEDLQVNKEALCSTSCKPVRIACCLCGSAPHCCWACSN